MRERDRITEPENEKLRRILDKGKSTEKNKKTICIFINVTVIWAQFYSSYFITNNDKSLEGSKIEETRNALNNLVRIRQRKGIPARIERCIKNNIEVGLTETAYWNVKFTDLFWYTEEM